MEVTPASLVIDRNQPRLPIFNAHGSSAKALGLVGNIVIGPATTATAHSLAATPGYIVPAVGETAPAMLVPAFIPMLMIASGYRESACDTTDCDTTVTCVTKAFGPWIGWIGGWGPAVSAIIVLADVAEIAAPYLFYFPLMLACFALGTEKIFRGETLNASTEVKGPDVY